MEKKIRIAQMGLGPIGNKVTQFLAEKANFEIAGAIDTDPAKAGQDIGVLAGQPALGVKVTPDLKQVLGGGNVDVVLLTTTSGLAAAHEQLLQILPYRVSVVSSCEELSYPWLTNPALAASIDAAARQNQVAVLATGVNPGFLMDFLPVVISGVCREVRQVTVERIQDAAFRRLPFQQKIGAGLTVQAFHEKVKEGSLRHVGLTESMHMIASALGWKLDKTGEAISPIIAEREVRSAGMTVKPGYVLGVQQLGRGMVNGTEAISMVFRAAIGEPDARDRVVIEGTPKIDICIKGGVNGDVATCAILANSIVPVLHAAPGLRTMLDIAPPRCFSSAK
jgi:4-hydroxy-tetrahydrodipicolinate reductase